LLEDVGELLLAVIIFVHIAGPIYPVIR